MSQHTFETTKDGARITLVAGYDRILDEVFYQAFQEGREQPILTSMECTNSRDLSVDDVRQAFEGNGLQAPATMYEQIQADKDGRVGNRIVQYHQDGSFDEKLPAPRQRQA